MSESQDVIRAKELARKLIRPHAALIANDLAIMCKAYPNDSTLGAIIRAAMYEAHIKLKDTY